MTYLTDPQARRESVVQLRDKSNWETAAEYDLACRLADALEHIDAQSIKDRAEAARLALEKIEDGK